MFRKFAQSIVRMFPQSLQNELRSFRNRQSREKIMRNWENSGKPVPSPHAVKQITIESYQAKSNFKVLVETGTFLGDMVNAQRKNFKQIYSIELGEKLWQDAVKRFASYPHIKIIQGDSSKVLENITSELAEPAIFWLDGHYSAGITARGEKDCPIYGELDVIFKHNRLNHILLIDDARDFNGKGDYPTIDQLTTFIRNKDPRYNISVTNDIICCVID